MQILQAQQFRRRWTRRLIRVNIVCLQEYLCKIQSKWIHQDPSLISCGKSNIVHICSTSKWILNINLCLKLLIFDIGMLVSNSYKVVFGLFKKFRQWMFWTPKTRNWHMQMVRMDKSTGQNQAQHRSLAGISMQNTIKMNPSRSITHKLRKIKYCSYHICSTSKWILNINICLKITYFRYWHACQ